MKNNNIHIKYIIRSHYLEEELDKKTVSWEAPRVKKNFIDEIELPLCS